MSTCSPSDIRDLLYCQRHPLTPAKLLLKLRSLLRRGLVAREQALREAGRHG